MKVMARMELKPGMVLGEDVMYREECIYPAETILDDTIIDHLKRYSIMCVTVKEKLDMATTRYQRIQYDENFKTFETQYNLALLRYKQILQQFFQTKVKPEDDALLQIYYDIYQYIPNGATLLDYLYTLLPNADLMTYSHCLSSALLAGTLADWLDMNEEARKTLILCGLYYDIGKLMLPYQILWKPDCLTEAEFAMIKEHPVIGYQLIKDLNIRQHVKNAVIMHHERLDGSGYPYHLTGENIDTYARYIAIVDAYIAMAAPRSYRSALTPLQILNIFENSIEKYDAGLLLPILQKIADAQIGNNVRLADGSEWEVFIIHPNKLSRPLLRNENNEVFDLLEHPEMRFT